MPNASAMQEQPHLNGNATNGVSSSNGVSSNGNGYLSSSATQNGLNGHHLNGNGALMPMKCTCKSASSVGSSDSNNNKGKLEMIHEMIHYSAYFSSLRK